VEPKWHGKISIKCNESGWGSIGTQKTTNFRCKEKSSMDTLLLNSFCTPRNKKKSHWNYIFKWGVKPWDNKCLLVNICRYRVAQDSGIWCKIQLHLLAHSWKSEINVFICQNQSSSARNVDLERNRKKNI